VGGGGKGGREGCRTVAGESEGESWRWPIIGCGSLEAWKIRLTF
jgi:hypothetical protein